VTLGAEYGERGELDRAERYLREAIRRDPKARGAWMNLANIQYLRSEIDSAAVSYRRELENYPHKDEVRIDLADIHIDRGDDAGAAALYREALRRNPRNRERILYRAGLLRDVHLDARGRSPWPQRERELALAAGIYRAYLAAADSPDAEVLGSLARLELSLGRFERAAEAADRLLALRPGAEEARALDLLAQTSFGDASARGAALSAWSGDPRLAAEAEALAELFRATGRNGLALPYWRGLLRGKRVAPEALNHAAASLLKEGKPAEAAPIWELLNEEIPDYPYALLNLGAVALEEGKTARARSLWERFLTLYPQHPEAEELRRLLQEKD
jgi:Tfp pilus assembly protein PilF